MGYARPFGIFCLSSPFIPRKHATFSHHTSIACFHSFRYHHTHHKLILPIQETKLEGSVEMDDTLLVNGSSKLASVTLGSLAYAPYVSITNTGTIPLGTTTTSYRVDTSVAMPVNLTLPLVSSVPGLTYQIAKSSAGVLAIATLNVQGTDQLCTSSACTLVNPVYTFPGRASQVTITNDGVSVWFVNV